MRSEFAKCLRQGSIALFSAAKRLVSKEFGQADHDLQAAVKSNDNGEHKWATIQAYYAMFHAARALLYAEGYREKSHYCLSTALLELNGMITNDKFCLTRRGALGLSWWRRPLRLRNAAD
jgi:hypothetical protein